ncbi:SusC/RagA family TonB-linked outer membrane protein [Flavobacterium galactosidilyticum]|uniref:SusC/RagA family TonB-linked outer membrane protein n=1 Tax=Flavobacterium galactosidilyticum TaxID=2893886 RepID=UPI001E456429|nr:SusC/RagA family TonB-linked outer membrane protein [Flavobacterium sp. F-340]UFH46738.1 SusC/RagA family TonB-linked outer membrane protein [Flavobacterium sp. F-340]
MKLKFNGFLVLLLVLVAQITFAQERVVSGTVSDNTGLPIPGVNVLVKGSQTSTQTDFDGKFSIKATPSQVLVFSYIGMKSQEASASNAKLNVKLKDDSVVLEGVVVTALGIKRRPKELAYSTDNIKSEDLTKTKAVNVATALAGKVSGLQVNVTNNGVNPSTRVVLRGNRSLLGNNEALIVIDGFPSSRGVLDRINPNDIDNVTILKGANASALYGTEAANGVLVITTKKGSGKLSITYNNSVQLETVSYLPQIQDEFGVGGFPDGTLYPLENVNWGPRYDGRMVEASETLDDGSVWLVPFTPVKNNVRNFFNTGVSTRHGVTFKGGDETSDFLFSVDQTNTTGIVPKDTYNRTNVRLKGSRKYNNLTVGGNVSFYRSHANQVSEVAGRQGRPLYWNVLNTPLHIPLDQMQNWQTGQFTRNEVSFYRFYENPYFIIDTQREKNNYTEFNMLSNIDYKFTDWLTLSVNTGYTSNSADFKRQFGAFTYAFHLKDVYSEMDAYGASTANRITNGQRFNNDILLKFDKDINKDFNTKLTVGANTRLTTSNQVSVNGDNLIIPDFYNVSTRTGELGGGEYADQFRRQGVYGDFTLGFRDYLFLNVTARNDWSSTLPKDNNSFFYPGAGISFVVSDAFPGIKSDNGIDVLKATVNVTKTGNDPEVFATQGIFSAPAGFPYGSLTGLSQGSRDPDINLNPEFTLSKEVGVELSLFRSRLTFNGTYYQTNSTDQIVPIEVSLASGAGSILTNIGEIENKGLELDLKGTILKTQDFSWKLGTNYSGIKSKVLSLFDGVEEVNIGGFADAQVIAKVGESYPLLKTSAYTKDPQGRVIVGPNGNPLKDSKNAVQGKTTPDYILGMNTTFSYKGWTLYAVADYRTGHVFYNNIDNLLSFTGLSERSVTAGRQPFVFPNSSYSDGAGGFIANENRLTNGGGNAFWDEYNTVLANYISDATTLKLREVSLSYDFSSTFTDKVGIQSMNVGVFGRNLLTLRPKSNVTTDPEFNFTTGNAVGVGTQAQTPPTRQFGLNFNITF